MLLPSAALLPALAPDRWREFGARLATIGLDAQCVGDILQHEELLLQPSPPPLRTWRLRRRADAPGFAMRMLMFGDAVTREEASLALGDRLLEALTGAGFIVSQQDGSLVSPFRLHVSGNTYAISDVPVCLPDSVFGVGSGALLLRQAAPPGAYGRVLDLGCGAGLLALSLASTAACSVGTDVNPRAVLMARINAAINGIANVEFRQGDLFEPVEGERFDLIVSHPPFVAMPPSASPVAFLYGGTRGDELPLKILSHVRTLLNPSGRALLLAQWPDAEEQPLESRIRNVVGPTGLNVLVLNYPSVDPDGACTLYASGTDPALGETFASTTVRYRDHLDRLGIHRLQTAFVVVERTRQLNAWTVGIQIPEYGAGVTGSRIERILAAQNLAASGCDALLDAVLRLPEGAIFAEERVLPDLSAPAIFLRLPSDALSGPIRLNETAWALALTLHSAATVRDAIVQFADARRIPFDSAAAELLPAIKRALLEGVVEPHAAD